MAASLPAARTADGQPAVGGRRTQEERRAAARRALLGATIETIVELGYARATTRAIAERAGLTLGALQHHFASKAELVAAAVGDLAANLTSAVLADTTPRGRSERELIEHYLDVLWGVHRGPLFTAAIELWVAARTDPELESFLADLDLEIRGTIAGVAPLLLPGPAASPAFEETVLVGLATMRGLALQGFVAGIDPDLLWPRARSDLATSLAALEGEGEVAER